MGVTILLVYADDIIVVDNNEFEIQSLEKIKRFLWIEVAHSKKGIFISQ